MRLDKELEANIAQVSITVINSPDLFPTLSVHSFRDKMPIDWGNRETIFRLLAAAFAVIGKEGVSTTVFASLSFGFTAGGFILGSMVAHYILNLFALLW